MIRRWVQKGSGKILGMRLVALCLVSISLRATPGAAVESSAVTAPSHSRGQVVGRIWVEGRLENPLPLKVFKNQEFCGSFVPDESLLVSRERGLQNAVVTLHGASKDIRQRRVRSLILDNKDCAFVPHVQIAPVGSELLILNSDPILHAVHARLGPETLFNIGLPTWRSVRKQLDREGILALFCDVLHTWMTAFIVVTPSVHFAVSDKEGKFSLDGIPAGEYEMRVWHEKLGTQIKRLNISEGMTSRIQVTYRSRLSDSVR